MATIVERITASGRKVQRVRIRLKGYPEQNATFKTKKEAKDWAKITEAAIIEGRHFASKKAKGRTLGDAIDRYLEDNLPLLSESSQRGRRRHMEYWKKCRGGTATAARWLVDCNPVRTTVAEVRMSLGGYLHPAATAGTDRSGQ